MSALLELPLNDLVMRADGATRASRSVARAALASTQYQDGRLRGHVRNAGVKVCCGGILGMGERHEDRADLIVELAKLEPHPESIPINQLVPIPGTPLGDVAPIGGLDFVRWIAVARIVFPASYVRLAAGRDQMSQELQAMCLLAGANSIFVGDKLLTTPLPGEERDRVLLEQVERTEAGQ